MAEMNFNPNDVPPDERGPMDALPPGKYDLMVVESSVVPTRSGQGTLLKLTHQVVAGPFENRKLWSQHNYQHSNAMAQQIGQREIADLCFAIGHSGMLNDSNDLHGIAFTATVGIEKGQDGTDRNTVKRFLPYVGSPAAQPTTRPATSSRPDASPTPQQAARPAPATTGNRPAFLGRGTPGQTKFGS